MYNRADYEIPPYAVGDAWINPHRNLVDLVLFLAAQQPNGIRKWSDAKADFVPGPIPNGWVVLGDTDGISYKLLNDYTVDPQSDVYDSVGLGVHYLRLDATNFLPDQADNAGKVLTTDGVNVSWRKASRAFIVDNKAYNVDGGTFTSGTWRQRDFNTVLFDPDSIVSIVSNSAVLQAGEYWIDFGAPAYRVGGHRTLFWDSTNSLAGAYGSSAFGSADANEGEVQTWSKGVARVSISTPANFQILHYCQTTHATSGFGRAHGIANASNNHYSYMDIQKII